DQLIALGLELLERRRVAMAALQREVVELYPKLAGHGRVVLQYDCSLGDQPSQERFREQLESRFGDECRRGMTLVGPHREDVHIELDERDIRRFGSRGQQRLMALALRLAEARPVAEAVGSSPVLLLDDALSELDAAVQDRVLEHVAWSGQVFLTTADAVVAESRIAARWDVRGGCVTESERLAAEGAA